MMNPFSLTFGTEHEHLNVMCYLVLMLHESQPLKVSLNFYMTKTIAVFTPGSADLVAWVSLC